MIRPKESRFAALISTKPLIKEYFFCMVINICLLPASSRRPDQRRLRGCLLSSYILLIDLTNKEPPPASGGQTFPRTPQTCGLAFMDMVYTNSKSLELIKSRKMELLSARISRSLLLARTTPTQGCLTRCSVLRSLWCPVPW